MPTPFHVCNTAVSPGETVQIDVDIARLPSRTPITMPVVISRGAEDGPALLLLAGMHGDEINGIEILRRVITKGYNRPERGTVLCIPLVNVYGFINFSRDVPDGKDVNRSFPGSESGSLASRIAHRIVRDILPLIDCGIDFHTGGASRSNYPQIRCVLDEPGNASLAEAFAPPFIINAPLRSKSLRQVAAAQSKRILVYEGGESLRFDEYAIEEGIAGTRRLMAYVGLTHTAPAAPISPVTIQRTSWVRARNAGLFNSHVTPGDAVRNRQLVGTITDPYGDFEVQLRSPFEGFVIGHAHNPVVHQGDALLHIGCRTR